MDPMMIKDEHHDGDYGNSPWMEYQDYHSPHIQSPAQEYPGFGFMASSHGLPLESTFNRSTPLSYSSHQSPSLITAQWPSMLTNPSSSSPPVMSTPPIHVPPPLAPISTYNIPHALPPSTNPLPTPSARRTLTDQDRRRMCQYHEDNPTVKQTEIGAMFGVERSTVSKVLRQKDKYLCTDDGSRSPIKRSKGKFPDIERALSNWARNHQRQGLPLSDAIIRDKARFFATTVGSSESHIKVNSSSWLEKFKQKNHLLGSKPRKGSDTNDSDSTGGLNVDSQSGSQTPNGISPISPPGICSPSTMSPSRSGDSLKTDSPDSYLDFSDSYKHAHSQSATSLASCFSDNTAPSSFSGGPTSPTSPFFSQDFNCGTSPFLPSQHPRLMSLPSANTTRPRSQTFPMVGVEPSFSNSPTSCEPLTPTYLQQSMTAPTLETPIEELPEDSLGLGLSMQQQNHNQKTGISQPNQTNSPISMAPPPHPITNSSSPTTSNISSPTGPPPSQEEAKRALEVVMTFFRHRHIGFLHPQEYIVMGKLMEKLNLQEGSGELPGGMHSMHIEEKEMGRKRSIHSL